MQQFIAVFSTIDGDEWSESCRYFTAGLPIYADSAEDAELAFKELFPKHDFLYIE